MLSLLKKTFSKILISALTFLFLNSCQQQEYHANQINKRELEKEYKIQPSLKIVKLHASQNGFYKYLYETLYKEIKTDTFYFKLSSWIENFKDYEKSLIPTVYKDRTEYQEIAKQDSIYLVPFYCLNGREHRVFCLKNENDTLTQIGGISWHRFVYLPCKKSILSFSSFTENEKHETYIEAKILKFNNESYWKLEKDIITLYLEEIEESNKAVNFYNTMFDSLDLSKVQKINW